MIYYANDLRNHYLCRVKEKMISKLVHKRFCYVICRVLPLTLCNILSLSYVLNIEVSQQNYIICQ